MENILKDLNPFDFSAQQEISRKILYLEDEIPMQIIILKTSSPMGFAVIRANKGREAISLFEEGSFNIALSIQKLLTYPSTFEYLH